MTEPTAALVVLAAGSGDRARVATTDVGGRRQPTNQPANQPANEPANEPANKVLREVAGHPMLWWSLVAADSAGVFSAFVLVARAGEERLVEVIASGVIASGAIASGAIMGRDVRVVSGGDTRHASEWAGLRALAADIGTGMIDVVALHDAARPMAPASLFADVVAAARARGGAVPGVPAPPLIAVDPDTDLTGLEIVAVQTPQAFRAEPLFAAYERAAADGFDGTDTAACLEHYRTNPAVGALDIAYVTGPPANIKVTYARDFARVTRLLRAT